MDGAMGLYHRWVGGLLALAPLALHCSSPYPAISGAALAGTVPAHGTAGSALAWVAVLALAGGLSLALGVNAWRRHPTAGRSTFGLLMFALAGWCLAYACESLSRTEGIKLLWTGVEYVFIPAVPLLWLLFTLEFTGRGRWLTRRHVAWLCVVPVLAALLEWTNPAHGWFYRATRLDAFGSWPILVVEHGPLFWPHAAFSYLCLLAGTLFLVGAFLRTSPIYRRQTAVLLAGSLIPWTANLVYLAGLSPWPELDLTPVAFTLSGLVMAFGLFRYRLLEVVPVARRAVVEGLPAAMIVLDAEGRIADLNPAAEKLFGLVEREVAGRPAVEVLEPADIVQRFSGVAQADAELSWGEAGDRRTYRVTISPLGEPRAGLPARLILVSDVTAQAQAREGLERANRRLRALQQSTAALTAIRKPADLFEQALGQVEGLVTFRRAVLALWDEVANGLGLVAQRGFGVADDTAAAVVNFQPLAEWVVRHKAPFRAEDTPPGAEARSGQNGLPRSVLIVPLLYGERCLGVLGVGSPEPAVYGAAEQDLLLAFAGQVATALENTRLYGREQARRRLADTLQEAGRTLSTTLAPNRVLALLMDEIEHVVDYQGAIAWLLRDHRLELMAARGRLDAGPKAANSLDVSDNAIYSEMASTGRPVVIADVARDPRWEPVPGFEYAHAWIGVPLSIGDRIIGQLTVCHPQPGHYSAEDGEAVLGLARQAAAAIENARLHEETERWAARLRVLYEVSTAAATAASLEETAQRTVDALQQTMESDGAALLLLEPDTGELVMRAWAGYAGGPVLTRRRVGVGIPGWVVQTGQPALIADVGQDPRYDPADGEARSELCVPLRAGRRVIGVLKLKSRQPAAFREEDLHLLTTLAGHLATIIDNAALGEEAQARAEVLARRNRHLTLLHEIARVASSTLELPDLYPALADRLAQIIDGDGCYITRLDEATGVVLGGAAYGPYRDDYRAERPPPGELTLTESVLKAGRPLAVEDVLHSPYISPRIAEHFPARSQLALPLRLGGRNLGAVLIAFNQPHVFTEDEISWAVQAVDLSALALENARLYAEARAWAGELERRVDARTRELQAAQTQLLHAERLAALGRLSAGIAHEIGNPLGLIHGYIELLAGEQPDQPYVPVIQKATDRLIGLLAQLRDFSKPSVEIRSAVAVSEVLDRALTLTRAELKRHRVQVYTDLAAGLLPIRADARQLEQVFLNLVLNACDAMPKGGELRIRTRCETGRIVVELADSGMGIAPENLERVFEPYFSTKADRGTGLGLAICRRLVEAHGGQIAAESTLGVGTTFRVWLPVGGGEG